MMHEFFLRTQIVKKKGCLQLDFNYKCYHDYLMSSYRDTVAILPLLPRQPLVHSDICRS